MANSSDLPDTENLNVAALATAWAIVKVTYNIPNLMGNRDSNVKVVTNAVIKAYQAILDNKPIEK